MANVMKTKNLLEMAGNIRYYLNCFEDLNISHDVLEIGLGYRSFDGEKPIMYLTMLAECEEEEYSRECSVELPCKRFRDQIVNLFNTSDSPLVFYAGLLKIQESLNGYIRKCTWELLNELS